MNEGPPKAKVVDLRRWREERDRQRKAGAASAEAPAGAPFEPIPWPFRLLALISGAGFLAFGLFLVALVLWVRGEEDLPWYSLGAFLLLTLPLGLASALFGIDLVGRGLLGRDWTRPSWMRLSAWLDRRARPLPISGAVSFLLRRRSP